MGVKWLLRWQHPGTLPSRQAYDRICGALDAMQPYGANKRRWAAQYVNLQVVQDPTNRAAGSAAFKDVSAVTFQDDPQTTFMLQRQTGQMITTTRSILAVLDKTTGHKARATLHFEGVLYTLGDFHVRVGKVVTRPNKEFKGIMVDIEYTPVVVREMAEAALKEFVEILQGATNCAAGWLEVAVLDTAPFDLGKSFTKQSSAALYGHLAGLLLSGR